MKRNNEDTRPSYEIIYSALREKIFGGELNPGDILPSENALCDQFSVSRETARKALKQLENEGLVRSVPQRGYFVNNPQHDEFTLTFSEEHKNCWSKYRDVKGILPDEEIQEALKVAPDTKVIEFSRITYDGDFPIALDIKYMPYDRAYPSVESEISYAVFPEIAAAKVKPFDLYTDMEVSAVSAKGDIADALECAEGEPLLQIARWFMQQNGHRIAYSKHYTRQPYGKLHGTSGYHFEQ